MPAQVEVEPVEILGGHEVDRGDAVELALERRRSRRRRRVGEVEVVVQHVVAAVAGEREVGVPGARSAGRETRFTRLARSRRCAAGRNDQSHRHGHSSQPSNDLTTNSSCEPSLTPRPRNCTTRWSARSAPRHEPPLRRGSPTGAFGRVGCSDVVATLTATAGIGESDLPVAVPSRIPKLTVAETHPPWPMPATGAIRVHGTTTQRSLDPPRRVVSTSQKLKVVRRLLVARTVATFNGHDVMVVKVKGEFVWHKHNDTDNF